MMTNRNVMKFKRPFELHRQETYFLCSLIRSFILRIKKLASLAIQNVSSEDSVDDLTFWWAHMPVFFITKTRLCNFDPLKTPLLYCKTGVNRGMHYFSSFCSKI